MGVDILLADKNYYPRTIPTGLGWDGVNFPVVPTLSDPGSSRNKNGSAGITPEAMFGLFSTALSAPATTYYVTTTGSDSNNGLTSGTAFATMSKAITMANSSGGPTKIIVAAGLYYKGSGPAGTVPTVDVAFVATGGRVNVGTFDNNTFTADGTFTNCYVITLSNVERVYSLTDVDRWGNYIDLTDFGTTAGTAAVTLLNNAGAVNGWAYDSTAGKLYVRRADAKAVTSTNTRVGRTSVDLFKFTSAVNVYMGDGGADGYSGFDLEGGGGGAAFYYAPTVPGSVLKAVVVSQSTAKYAGYRANTGARGFSVDGIYGISYFNKCDASCNYTDGFNIHNTAGLSTKCVVLSVNCTGNNNGRGTAQSCNGWTTHEDVVGIDIAGRYEGNRGGTCRSVNSSKSYLLGTVVVNDLGDKINGGSIPPCAFNTSGTATYWLEQCAADMPAGTYAALADAGTTINLKNMWPTSALVGGAGTIGSF